MKTSKNLKIVVGICGVLFVIFLPSLGGAQDILIATQEIPPSMYLEDESPTGFSTEIVEAVFTKAGLPFEIKVYPWARAYAIALNQNNVLIYPMARTPERESSFIWVGKVSPLLRTGFFWRTARQDITITSLEDVKRYRIGVRRNSNFHEFLLEQEGFADETNVFPVPSMEQNVKKLLADRIDLILDVNIGITAVMNDLDVPTDHIDLAWVLSEIDAYMAFSQKTSDVVIQKVQTAYKQVQADGTIDAIFEKYLGTEFLNSSGANQ